MLWSSLIVLLLLAPCIALVSSSLDTGPLLDPHPDPHMQLANRLAATDLVGFVPAGLW